MCLVYFYSNDSRGAVKEEWIFDRWDKIVKNKNGGGIGIETSDASWERFGKRITPRESCPINFLHGTNRNSTRIHAYTDITARCNSRALPRFTKIEAFHPLFPFVRRLFSFSTRDYYCFFLVSFTRRSLFIYELLDRSAIYLLIDRCDISLYPTRLCSPLSC